MRWKSVYRQEKTEAKLSIASVCRHLVTCCHPMKQPPLAKTESWRNAAHSMRRKNRREQRSSTQTRSYLLSASAGALEPGKGDAYRAYTLTGHSTDRAGERYAAGGSQIKTLDRKAS